MLKKIRLVLAGVFFIGITLLFTGVGTSWWGWMAKLQFLPAVLGLNLAVIAGVLLATLLLGRLYCSVICPLGVFQDIIIWVRKIFAQKAGKHNTKLRKKYSYRKENRILRYGVLSLIVVCIASGLQGIVLLVAPYSAYGRMVSAVADRSTGWPLIAIAAVTFVLIVILAWTNGRWWCNSICPVGTTLGLVSRFSAMRISIDKEKCIRCRRCEMNCKSSCIDIKGGMKIDSSRCVDCFDCIGVCPKGAINLRFSWKTPASSTKSPASNAVPPTKSVPSSRREFLKGAAIAGGALMFNGTKASAQLQGGMAQVIGKQDPPRDTPICPPGAVSNFYDRCTACQLCISNCPNHVLKPSGDLAHLLQPHLSYTDGWCRSECNTCGTLCPAGAILPLAKFEKLSLSWGVSHIEHSECLQAKGVSCLNCVRHCPVGAIRVIRTKDGLTLPVVNEEQCIGCGACENLCPVRPVSAARVNGRARQQRLN